MSSLQSALLASGTVVALVLAFVAFRMAARGGASAGAPWAAAGGTVVAFALDVASVMSALGLPDNMPDAGRVAWTVFGALCAAAVAVVAYSVSAPVPLTAGATGPAGGAGALHTRVFAAGGAFTGALTVMGVLATLLA